MSGDRLVYKRSEADRDWSGPIKDDPKTLDEMIRIAVDRYGDRPALGFRTGQEMPPVNISFNELGGMIDAAAASFSDMGIEAGDRIMMILDNCPQWAVSAYASNRLGAVHTATYTHVLPEDWLHIISEAEPKLLLVSDLDVFERVSEVMGTNPKAWPSAGVVIIDDEEASPKAPTGIKVQAWRDLIIHGRKLDPISKSNMANDPNALASLIWTSGTSGAKAKGVMLSNWNILSNIISVQGCFEIGEGDRSAAFLPWAHSFGQAIDLHWSLRAGVHVNIVSDPKRLADEAMRIKPTYICAVPRIWDTFHERVSGQLDGATGLKAKLVAKARKDAKKRIIASGIDCDAVPASGWLEKKVDKLVWGKVRARFGGKIRFCISGAAALNPDVAAFVQQASLACYEGYGASELSPMVAANGWMGPGGSKLRTVGKPIPGVEVRIATEEYDDDENPDQGEIQVCGPNVFQGYWRDEERTAEVMTEDGWYRTGDVGRLTEEGYLAITGRLKNTWKLANGKFVAAGVLEATLSTSPLIEQAILGGRDRTRTFVVVVPKEDELKSSLVKSGINSSGSLAELCRNEEVQNHVLEHLRNDICLEPVWKAYEKPATVILDHEAWDPSTNGLMTPTLKPRIPKILAKHADRIDTLE